MRQLLNLNNPKAKKSLGQNFIIDKNFIEKLCKFITSCEDTIIIEIGPGKGALTNLLVKKNYKKLYLIEKDNNLANNLIDKYKASNNIHIINRDALLFDFNQFIDEKNVIIVGNLPFNISTQLLFKWLEQEKWPPFYKKMFLMFQKEVAARIISKHNNRDYGRISVAAQVRCKIKKILIAPRKIFNPVPKVEGAVLEFKPSKKYKNLDFSKLQKILQLAFSKRRKKIKTNLKEYLHLLDQLNIDHNLRAENLTIEDYCKLVSEL